MSVCLCVSVPCKVSLKARRGCWNYRWSWVIGVCEPPGSHKQDLWKQPELLPAEPFLQQLRIKI